MSFGIPARPANRALASVIGDRIKSEASMVAARASFWRLLGFGGFCLLIGGGVGLALFGYSYVADGHRAMAQLTDAVADGLNKVTLKVEPVKIDPNSSLTVKIDPDATVRLDTTGATVQVHLDTTGVPTGRVVDSRDNVPRPTERQLNPNAPVSQLNPPVSQQPAPPTPVVNYTVFNTVLMAPGEVVTGWKYNSNADMQPVNQYCYYRISNNDTASTRYDLAVDGVAVPNTHTVPFDVDRALAHCVWFGHKT